MNACYWCGVAYLRRRALDIAIFYIGALVIDLVLLGDLAGCFSRRAYSGPVRYRTMAAVWSHNVQKTHLQQVVLKQVDVCRQCRIALVSSHTH